MQVPASGAFIKHMATESQVDDGVYLPYLVQEQRYYCEEESVNVGKDTVSHL
jgi:hypothetical protein